MSAFQVWHIYDAHHFRAGDELTAYGRLYRNAHTDYERNVLTLEPLHFARLRRLKKRLSKRLRHQPGTLPK